VIPRFSVYLFDIDGTLLDSAHDICGAIQQALEPTGRTADFNFLKRYIGRHLLDTFQDVLPEAPPEKIEELIESYRAIYPARGHKLTKVYPGVSEALAALGGLKSTATTKGSPNSRIILEQFGLLPHFTHVQGTDGFPHKPAPDVIFSALRAMNVGTEDCLMVGDASSDMEAGRRAGVKTCAVTYGYGNHDEMRKFEPDYWISDLRELAGDFVPASH
jgi:HAD superfamily hydrolase (TIGR01549 family)